MRVLCLLFVLALSVSAVDAGEVSVTLTPEYGSASLDQGFKYGDVIAMGTEYTATQVGLVATFRDDRIGVVSSVSHASFRSTLDYGNGKSMRTFYNKPMETVGSVTSTESMAQFYTNRAVHVDIGSQFVHMAERGHDVDISYSDEYGISADPMTWSVVQTFFGPSVGAGLNTGTGRLNVQLEGAWSPWLYRTKTRRSTVVGMAPAPYSRETGDASGISCRVLARMFVYKGVALSGEFQYRKIKFEQETYEGPPLKEHLSSARAVLGFSVLL
jgi:hypothetical protein